MAIRNALQGLVIGLIVWFNRHIRIAVDVVCNAILAVIKYRLIAII